MKFIGLIPEHLLLIIAGLPFGFSHRKLQLAFFGGLNKDLVRTVSNFVSG